MGLKEWLIPQDRAFFEWLDGAAQNTVDCADALHGLFTNYSQLAERRQQIKDLEHKGDAYTHNIFDGLARSFILPLDREDISALAKALDNICDFIYAASNRLHLYEIAQPTDEMLKFTKILQAQTREIAASLKEIQNKRTLTAAIKRGIEVNRLENEADRLLNTTMAELFHHKDPIHIMKLKEIYEMLETATDKCEDAADVLSDIVRKHG